MTFLLFSADSPSIFVLALSFKVRELLKGVEPKVAKTSRKTNHMIR